MLYLRFIDPKEHRFRNVAATPANMFAMCHVCGAEVNISMEEATRDKSIWGNAFMCPTCRDTFIRIVCDDDEDSSEEPDFENAPFDSLDSCDGFNPDEDEYEEEYLNECNDEECESYEASDDDCKKCCGYAADDDESCNAEERGVDEIPGQAFIQSLILPFLRTGIMSFVL